MGAKTPLAGIATGTLVAICLLFLTPVFQHLPVFILACVVLLSVRSLFDYKEAIYLWKVSFSLTLISSDRQIGIGHLCHHVLFDTLPWSFRWHLSLHFDFLISCHPSCFSSNYRHSRIDETRSLSKH